jgi:hypothetical protein
MDRNREILGLAQRLRQIGRANIGRVLGTVVTTAGRYKLWVDLLERSYFLRAEVNALSKLLLDKGVCTQEELQAAFAGEYKHLLASMSEEWPELTFEETGFTVIDPQAFSARLKREDWPR